MTDTLVAFVEQRAGESLRAIAHYGQTDIDLLYYRDDLATKTVTQRTATIHDNITWAWNPGDDDLAAELGDTHATLQVRDDAIIIHLLETHNKGYLIELGPYAARNLTSFLDQCLDHLE